MSGYGLMFALAEGEPFPVLGMEAVFAVALGHDFFTSDCLPSPEELYLTPAEHGTSLSPCSDGEACQLVSSPGLHDF